MKIALCILLASGIAIAAPGDIEGGLVLPTFPDRGLDVGGCLGIHLFDIPEWFPIAGALFPRHKIFGDVMYVSSGTSALGVSGSLKPSEVDNGLRAGVAAWKDRDEKIDWTLYIRNSWPIDLW